MPPLFISYAFKSKPTFFAIISELGELKNRYPHRDLRTWQYYRSYEVYSTVFIDDVLTMINIKKLNIMYGLILKYIA